MATFVQYVAPERGLTSSVDYGLIDGKVTFVESLPDDAVPVVFCMPDAEEWRDAYSFRAGTPESIPFEVVDEAVVYVRHVGETGFLPTTAGNALLVLKQMKGDLPSPAFEVVVPCFAIKAGSV